MVVEHCLIKNRTGQCTCNQGPMKLTDKTGAEFPIIKDGNNCRSVLLNGKKLYWLDRQEDLSKAVNAELIGYGRLPLMVTEHCLIRNKTGECTCHMAPAKLTDKTGAEFPIIKDGDSCRSVLLNGKKLSWLDRQDDLAKLGIWAVRLYFTTENSREVDRVMNEYMAPEHFDPGACTRGLYLRGVE